MYDEVYMCVVQCCTVQYCIWPLDNALMISNETCIVCMCCAYSAVLYIFVHNTFQIVPKNASQRQYHPAPLSHFLGTTDVASKVRARQETASVSKQPFRVKMRDWLREVEYCCTVVL